MGYKKFNFDDPVEKDENLFAIYDCSPDYGSITYLDGGQEKTYEIKDQRDFENLRSSSYSATTAFTFYDVTIPRANITKVVVGKAIEIVPDYFCTNCTNLVSCELSLKVKEIGSRFLFNCKSLNCPFDLSNVTSIGSNFLYGCTNFNSPIIFPKEQSNTGMGSGFMYNCSSFNQPIELPYGMVSWDSFMYGCKSFNQPIVMPDSVTQTSNSAFSYCDAFNSKITFSKKLKEVYMGFNNNKSFNQPLDFPSNITSLNGCFRDLESYNQPINIPGTITSLSGAFYSMKTFNQPVTLPNTLTKLSNSCFSRLDAFNQAFIIPNSVTELGRVNAWLNLGQRERKPVPNSITKIGSGILSNSYTFTGPLNIECQAYPDADTSTGGFDLWLVSLASRGDITKPIYSVGVTLQGPGASIWKDALSDLDGALFPPYETTPWYRKLILADNAS